MIKGPQGAARRLKGALMEKFRSCLRSRLLDESGAVTVDWVVLTAAVVSLGFLVGGVIWSQADNAAIDVANFVGSQTINSTF